MNSKCKLLFLLVLLIEIAASISLSSNNFCQEIPKKGCIPKNSKHHNYMKCEHQKCQKPFIYRCGNDTCVITETDCQPYLEYEKFVNSYIVKSLSRFIYFSENYKKHCAALVN